MAEQRSSLVAKADIPARWIDRKFSFDLPTSVFPEVLGRLESMPDTARQICESASDRALSSKNGGRWSAKQHFGHLDDLSSVDEKRLHDYLRNAPTLSPADVTNPKTEAANHNARPWTEIIELLTENRLRLTRQLAQLTQEQLVRTALHIRLQQQMRVIDWMWFLAEHDDHHIAAARAAVAAAGKES